MKKLLHNIYNFFYVALNWNFQLAFFVTWHEIKRGPRYGVNTILPVGLDNLTIAEGDKTKSSSYEALNFYILETLLDKFCELFPHEKSIVDIGSGKGRILVVAAHYGFTNITGIDFAEELCASAKKNVNKIKSQFPNTIFEIHCQDALGYPIKADDNVFFLFNPFNKEIMEKFAENIENSVRQYPRTIYFMYANPQEKEVLFQNGFCEIFTIKKLGRLEGTILVRYSEVDRFFKERMIKH